jgi:hypothetical protein
MQDQPLLQQIDWFFTSYQWTIKFPNSMVHSLARSTSDHVPCVVSISTSIPKAQIFWFENHWIQQPGFLQIVHNSWNCPVRANSAAGILIAKFKNLRHDLKRWGKNLSHIKLLIANSNKVILIRDKLEEERELSSPEFNFRNIVKVHLKRLLQIQYDYWEKRCTIRWVQLSGENTKFFHAKATERYMHNVIAEIKGEDGTTLIDHNQKAAAFWQSFKNRMGVSNPTSAPFVLGDFLAPN